jgi:fido (protein-threonine AMPylation protein)
MPSCVPWNSDDPADLPVIEKRLGVLLSEIATSASERRAPTVDMARDWHRLLHRALHIPEPYYAGEIRDRDPTYPCLVDYEVRVGTLPGVRAADVTRELAAFQESMQRATVRLDTTIPVSMLPRDAQEVWAVIQLCALAHGEWVRIHPFANGNGRTARLWANWCALRYGLPPFVRLRPRPDDQRYADASARSMQGAHDAMAALFLGMLLRTGGAGADLDR